MLSPEVIDDMVNRIIAGLSDKNIRTIESANIDKLKKKKKDDYNLPTTKKGAVELLNKIKDRIYNIDTEKCLAMKSFKPAWEKKCIEYH